MQLYAGSTTDFVRDSTHNAIAGLLADAFFHHYRYMPSDNERRSWHNSLRSLADVIRLGKLDDNGILLEYQLPLTSRRLDAMLTGCSAGADHAIIVELKQWETAQLSNADDLLRTWVGGSHRDVLHPSVQANQYRRYLEASQDVFHLDAARIGLESCAYLHNYSPVDNDALFAEPSFSAREQSPLFTMGDTARLADHLHERLGQGDGGRVLTRIAESRYKPAKKLLSHVARVIKDEPAFVLLDEQHVVFSKIMATVESGVSKARKQVFLIKGGPGTGKSVLAINLIGVLSGKGINAQHATGSKAFTRTLQRIVGTTAAQQFKFFNNFGQAGHNDVDVLICDEAHRIRKSSNHQYTRKEHRSDRPQIREIIDAARVAVFLLDDHQIVRPNEIGSTRLIRDYAAQLDCDLHEFELEAQFRCAGSESFIGWIDKTLAIRETPHVLFDQTQESFEFGIVGSAEQLDQIIRSKAAAGESARLVAGYCWPWSKELQSPTELKADVVIDSFRRPWNARPDMTGLPHGVPKADYWAHDPAGLDQIGCIYTAQGFEFDYVGVIWGKDLRYDPTSNSWVGDPTKSFDTTVKRSRGSFLELVKCTYRVLLSRGMKGCYVYFEDAETEKFVRSRTENLGKPMLSAPPLRPAATKPAAPESDTPFTRIRLGDVRPWENAVPLIDLKVAAGNFSDPQYLESDAVEWVALPSFLRMQPGQFVARVIGESMNRRVPGGSWALFSTDVRGSKQGKIVLAERRELGDPDEGGRFTLKIYDAVKSEGEDGAVYDAIWLRPSSTDPQFQPIAVDLDDDERPRIVALLVTALH